MIKTSSREKCVFSMCRGLLALVLVFSGARAATLEPETLIAWKAYVSTVSSRMSDRLRPGVPFLLIDENQRTLEAVRGGRSFVLSIDQGPHRISAGLIHDWVGATFIPNTDMDKVLSLLRDYSRYKDIYNPAVIDSRLLKREGSKDSFSMLLANRNLLSKAALDGDFECSYFRVDDRRWYSISEATRLQEVENYGTPAQHMLSENEGTGLIWRLLSITRFEERDGGVYVELEAVALSRDIPASLRWIVAPIVRRVSKASVLASLQQTSDGVIARDFIAIEASSTIKSSPLPVGTAALRPLNSLR